MVSTRRECLTVRGDQMGGGGGGGIRFYVGGGWELRFRFGVGGNGQFWEKLLLDHSLSSLLTSFLL